MVGPPCPPPDRCASDRASAFGALVERRLRPAWRRTAASATGRRRRAAGRPRRCRRRAQLIVIPAELAIAARRARQLTGRTPIERRARTGPTGPRRRAGRAARAALTDLRPAAVGPRRDARPAHARRKRGRSRAVDAQQRCKRLDGKRQRVGRRVPGRRRPGRPAPRPRVARGADLRGAAITGLDHADLRRHDLRAADFGRSSDRDGVVVAAPRDRTGVFDGARSPGRALRPRRDRRRQLRGRRPRACLVRPSPRSAAALVRRPAALASSRAPARAGGVRAVRRQSPGRRERGRARIDRVPARPSSAGASAAPTSAARGSSNASLDASCAARQPEQLRRRSPLWRASTSSRPSACGTALRGGRRTRSAAASHALPPRRGSASRVRSAEPPSRPPRQPARRLIAARRAGLRTARRPPRADGGSRPGARPPSGARRRCRSRTRAAARAPVPPRRRASGGRERAASKPARAPAATSRPPASATSPR